jgi:hypothetical protein
MNTKHLDLDARLDEALQETFPASDPVAVHARRRAHQNTLDLGASATGDKYQQVLQV